MNKKVKKIAGISLAVLVFLLFTLFLVRAFSERELDDVSPGMDCKTNLLEKSDVLWIVPKFEGKPISENPEWCKEILNMNKTLGLHGVSHEFREFGTNRNQTYLEEGMKIFEECFGYSPTMFKPPQLKITEENRKLIKNNGLILEGETNQILHRVYHCGKYGKKNNWISEWF